MRTRTWIGPNYLKNLGMVGLVLLLTGLSYGLTQEKIQELNAEKHAWQVQAEQDHPHVERPKLPKLGDFPKTLEECQRVFQAKNVEVLSVNLERFEENRMHPTETKPSSNMRAALFRFQLAGNWNAITRALQDLEVIPNHMIQIQEVRFNPEGAHLVLKIDFYEPDNPLLP